MDKNIESYVKVYDNWLDAEICKKTIIELETPVMANTFNQHTFYQSTTGTYGTQSGDRELDVSYAKVTPRDYLMQRVWDGFARYLTELGEFVMWKDKVIELKAGSVMIFPSIFLYPHRVEPIKKGTRHSFVSWAY